MDVAVIKSVLVRPASETPNHQLWLSNIDLIVRRRHTCTAYIYRPKLRRAECDLCVWKILRESLCKVLVTFYPFAGRMMIDETGRIAINCNEEGALFVEAVTDFAIDDLCDFDSPGELAPLVPNAAFSDSIPFTALPLLLLQVTKFKCGGIAVGVGLHHIVADGMSAIHFVNTWCEVARGLEARAVPYMDRTLLRARNPTKVSFNHTEHAAPPPPLLNKDGSDECKQVSFGRFRLSKEKLYDLKAKLKDNPTKKGYSTYVTLAAHIWKCCCIARGLLECQKTKVYIAVDGRQRLRPPLPVGFFGNAIITATPMGECGEIVSKPLWYTAGMIQTEIDKMDDEYLRSHLDFLELQPDISPFVRSNDTFKSPNMSITSWTGMPIYAADFGLGKPFFMGHAGNLFEGHSCVMSSGEDDGSVIVVVTLLSDQMDRFRQMFYQI